MKIYLDHASTTPVDEKVLEAMLPYLRESFGNPSTLYSLGQEAKDAMEKSREKVASAINASPEEIIFTSGGTEADNFALKGIVSANRDKGNHIITSEIEHHAILHPCEYLESQGFKITYIPVDKEGIVRVKDVEDSITKETVLVSIMMANNEIGTLQPIEEIGRITRERGIYFHTDGVQGIGKIPVDVGKLNVDLLSISGHKIYGPKGVGALYVRKGTRIDPILHGGGHERNLRSGTENVPGIIGLGKAMDLAVERLEKESARLTKLRDHLIEKVLEIENSMLNGHPTQRLSNNANFSFKGVEGESLVLKLDGKGICASTGSACSSHSLEPSHVLKAIGLSPMEAHGSLRLTLGKDNTEEDIDYVLKTLPEIVEELRGMSPTI